MERKKNPLTLRQLRERERLRDSLISRTVDGIVHVEKAGKRKAYQFKGPNLVTNNL